MCAEQRQSHPFYMYDCIISQPEEFVKAFSNSENAVSQCVSQLSKCKTVYLVGIGTSYHAAQIGQYILRLTSLKICFQAHHSFDFALYGSSVSSEDGLIAISHRGNKHYTSECINKIQAAGGFSVLITGKGGCAKEVTPDISIETVEQDSSSAHTVSYLGAIAVLSRLAVNLQIDFKKEDLFSSSFFNHDLYKALKHSLACEDQVHNLAEKSVDHRRIWLVGGGPNAITAQEIALKIKETSYAQAEGMSIEAMFHGPFQCAEKEDLFILIAPKDPSQKRVLELPGLINEIGADCIVISDEHRNFSRVNTICVKVPKVAEPFSAITMLIPLQLFSYYLAIAKGTNPDSFRLDDPRFAKAYSLVTL
jgi:glucosamine--fructose-6-phosphate aminotransferase (isomerizing)